MSWTTGPRLFNKFQMHLEDDHETKWDDITSGLNETVAIFDEAISEFTSQRFQPDDYHVHKKFLLSVRKPGEVDPEMFLSLVRYHNRLLALLPGVPLHQCNEAAESHLVEAVLPFEDEDDAEAFYVAKAHDLEPELYDSDDESLPGLVHPTDHDSDQ